jgi:tight adherence protein C
MSGSIAGAVLGAAAGGGAWLVVDRVRRLRWTSLAGRVLPYLRDLPERPGTLRSGPTATRALLAAGISGLAVRLDALLGGSASVGRRLARANLATTVHEFRIEQAVWGVVGFLAAAVPSVAIAARHPDRGAALMIVCLASSVLAVLLRENRLSGQVARRERRISEELPVVAELLALAVAAGEGPTAALDRVVSRSGGEFATDLGRVLAEVRTGTPLAQALDALATRTGLPAVSRFAQGMAIAIERGTPLADVLHAQAGDVREVGRRALIESGARREVLMMVPVVFLVLPTVVVFAFWPGLVGLDLVVT